MCFWHKNTKNWKFGSQTPPLIPFPKSCKRYLSHTFRTYLSLRKAFRTPFAPPFAPKVNLWTIYCLQNTMCAHPNPKCGVFTCINMCQSHVHAHGIPTPPGCHAVGCPRCLSRFFPHVFPCYPSKTTIWCEKVATVATAGVKNVSKRLTMCRKWCLTKR